MKLLYHDKNHGYKRLWKLTFPPERDLVLTDQQRSRSGDSQLACPLIQWYLAVLRQSSTCVRSSSSTCFFSSLLPRPQLDCVRVEQASLL